MLAAFQHRYGLVRMEGDGSHQMDRVDGFILQNRLQRGGDPDLGIRLLRLQEQRFGPVADRKGGHVGMIQPDGQEAPTKSQAHEGNIQFFHIFPPDQFQIYIVPFH